MTTATVRQDRRRALLEAALASAERGWHVFPLVPGGKRPAVRDWETRATADPARIIRCWDSGEPYNIGLACGPSSLVVLDLDIAKPDEQIPPEYEQCGFRSGDQVLADLQAANGDIPDTLMVATASGGEHWYFAAPGDLELRNTAGRLGWKIDTRASGGYVVAPGSLIAGITYTVVLDLAPAQLPAWICDQLIDRPAAELSGTAIPADPRRRREYVAAAIRGELTRVLTAPPGTRNTNLFKAASQLGQLVATGDLDQAVAHAALVTVGQAVGQRPTEANKTVASGLRNGAAQPRKEAAARRPPQRHDQTAANLAMGSRPSRPSRPGPGQPWDGLPRWDGSSRPKPCPQPVGDASA